MAKIDSAGELQEAIAVLEAKHKEELKQLRKEFTDVKERLKPKNLLIDGLYKLKYSSALRKTLILGGVGLVSGIAIKKLLRKRRMHHAKKMNLKYQYESPTTNQVKRISGSLIQYIVAAIISRNSDKIKSLAYHLLSNMKTTKTTPETETGQTDSTQ